VELEAKLARLEEELGRTTKLVGTYSKICLGIHEKTLKAETDVYTRLNELAKTVADVS